METSETLKINIKNLSGVSKSLEVKKDVNYKQILVSELKSELSQIFNAPIDLIRLIYQGKLFKDSQPIKSYIKEDGVTIHLLVKSLDSEETKSQPSSSSQSSLGASRHTASAQTHNPQRNSRTPPAFTLPNSSIEYLINVINQQLNPSANAAATQLTSDMSMLLNMMVELDASIKYASGMLALLIRNQQDQQLQSMVDPNTVDNRDFSHAFREFKRVLLQDISAFVEKIQNSQTNPNPPRPAANGICELITLICSILLGEVFDTTLADIIDYSSESAERSPLISFVMSLTIRKIVESIFGDGDTFEKLAPLLKQEILRLIQNNSQEYRHILAHCIFSAFHIVVPQNFISRIRPGFAFSEKVVNSFVFWGKRGIDLMLDFQGQNISAEIKKLLALVQGNCIEIAKDALNGNLEAAKDLMAEMTFRATGEGASQCMAIISPVMKAGFNYTHDLYLKWVSEKDLKSAEASQESVSENQISEDVVDTAYTEVSDEE